jgi:hypothetical protein
VAGLGEQVTADVFDAASQVQADRAFGDQGPVPWPPQPFGQPPRHLVQLGQQTVALVTIGGAGLPGQGHVLVDIDGIRD